MALQVSEAQAVGDWGSSIPDKHNDTLVPLPLHPCLVCWGPDTGSMDFCSDPAMKGKHNESQSISRV